MPRPTIADWYKQHGTGFDGETTHKEVKKRGRPKRKKAKSQKAKTDRKEKYGWVLKKGVWYKPCSICKKVLDLDKFYIRKTIGPSSSCKICTRTKTVIRLCEIEFKGLNKEAWIHLKTLIKKHNLKKSEAKALYPKILKKLS